MSGYRARPARCLLWPPLLGAGLLALCFGSGTLACFGIHLRVGVLPEADHALASYAAGYYVEEKTGIQPDFVEISGDPADAIARGEIDLFLARGSDPLPESLEVRPAGDIPGLGPGQFWIRPDVLDDLRFYTVDRTLGRIPRFYGSAAYRDAQRSDAPPRKAARQAVLRAEG